MRAPTELRDVGGILGVANFVVLAGLDAEMNYINTKSETAVLPLMASEGSATVLAAIRAIVSNGQAALRCDEWLDAIDPAPA